MVLLFDPYKRLMAPPMQPSSLRFLFLNLGWIVFLFSLIPVSNSQTSPITYDKNVPLEGQQVTFFWTLSKDTISIKAKGGQKSGYLAIGFGTGMVNSYAYVGWFDGSGKGKVSTYWIDGKNAKAIHSTKENLTNVSSKLENGMITFEFTRVLNPSCDPNVKIECGNIIDPGKPLKVVWAMGPLWSEDDLSMENVHFAKSKNPTDVMLELGISEVDDSLPLPFVVHGILMFVGWGLILPAGVICARYLKHLNGDKWFQLHLYLQYTGLAIVIIAFIFVVVTIKGLELNTWHTRCGFVAILLGVAQPVNAYFRPAKPASWDEPSSKRVIWEYIHMYSGRFAIIVAFAALITGLKFLSVQYGVVLTYLLIAWICVVVIMMIFLEIRQRKRRRDSKIKTLGDAQLVDEDFKIVI